MFDTHLDLDLPHGRVGVTSAKFWSGAKRREVAFRFLHAEFERESCRSVWFHRVQLAGPFKGPRSGKRRSHSRAAPLPSALRRRDDSAVAKVRVEGSNPFARSKISMRLNTLRARGNPGFRIFTRWASRGVCSVKRFFVDPGTSNLRSHSRSLPGERRQAKGGGRWSQRDADLSSRTECTSSGS